MADNKKDGKIVNMYLSGKTIKNLEKYCELTGATRTKAVELAVDKYVKEFFKKIK